MLEKPIYRYIGTGLIVVGAMIIVVAAVIACASFYGYRIPEFTSPSLEETITKLMYTLVEITVRLGFLGVMVWGGGVLLKYGIESFKIEAKEPTFGIEYR
ncbi:MAG: hypothetical protein QXV81_05745 [Ignisphaera sp.]|uniref:Uncharacterized protein n=1 Tax=Ignisphaera aggregans TaxID=334771 RepID=A0A7J3I8J0_9CREN